GQILVDVIAPAEARYILIAAPPNIAQPELKISQRNVARVLALLAGRRLPGVERSHGKNAIGLFPGAHGRQRSARWHVRDEMAARPGDSVVAQRAFPRSAHAEQLQ